MDKTSLIMGTLMGLVMVLWIAPSVIAMNRGKVLRNVALWLGIILALGFFYRTFGPGRPATSPPAEQQQPASADSAKDSGDPASQDDDADQGAYTPPEE